MNPGLVNHTVSSFAVDTADPSILYAGVDGAGVWVMTMAPIGVEGITPDSGPASGGTEIAVAGTDLADEATVQVGGVDSPSVTFVSDTLLAAAAPEVTPGTLNDVRVVNANGASATLSAGWFADFVDVDAGNIYHDDVETIVRAGITAGCGSGNYCVAAPVSRAQMAVFLLKAKYGSAHVPPDCTGVFDDVPCPGPFTHWIEQLAAEGITAGCDPGALLPRQPGHPRADGGLSSEDEGGLDLCAAPGDRRVRRRARRILRRGLDRGALRPRDHGRLLRFTAALLPHQRQHARSDGGVPG